MEDNIINSLEEKPHLKIIPYYVKFGLIATFIGIIISIIIYLTGLEHNQGIGYASYIAAIIVMIFCLSTYKSDNGNRLIGNTGFKMGFMMFLIFGILSALFFLLYISVISPDFTENLIEKTIEKLEEGGMSDETIEQQMSFSAPFFKTQFFITMSLVMTLIVGLISSGIAAAVMKTESKK